MRQRDGGQHPLNGRSWVYTPSALYTDARPILSALAISVARLHSLQRKLTFVDLRIEPVDAVINNFTFDGATRDPIQRTVRDALIAFMAATSQAQAEATKAAQRAGIEHAKQSGERAYLGRKPSFTREQFVKVRAMLGQQTVGIAQIARETGLTRQTVYRIKADPVGAEGALVAWEL
jgi:DNA invertase Pin-like site-specific DNA recombinase